MTLTNRIGRPLLAAMFISGGIDQLRNPEGRAFAAAKIRDDLDDTLEETPPLPDDADMVRINGAVQLVGGSLLALNKLPRLASLALAGSLVPTTLGAHRFWEIEDEQERSTQQIHFFKNMAMFGGLLIAAGDTGARPSVAWRTRRAVAGTATGVAESARDATESARGFGRSRKRRGKRTAHRLTDTLTSTKNTAAPVLADAADSASDALSEAGHRASEAFERAQPVVESATKESRAKLQKLWAALIPVALTARARSRDVAAQASDLAGRSRTAAVHAARGAADRGSAAVRSIAA